MQKCDVFTACCRRLREGDPPEKSSQQLAFARVPRPEDLIARLQGFFGGGSEDCVAEIATAYAEDVDLLHR